MLNSEIAIHSEKFPPGFQRDFDAHVYYDKNTREIANKLREKAIAEFRGQAVFVGSLVDQKVGPHPTPMFELNFPKSLDRLVFDWLEQHRDGLVVLVHEVTGDDARDHFEGATWLGERLDLDESKLDPSPTDPRAFSPKIS